MFEQVWANKIEEHIEGLLAKPWTTRIVVEVKAGIKHFTNREYHERRRLEIGIGQSLVQIEKSMCTELLELMA